MADTVIKVENLSKRYLIGTRRNSQDGLRHRVENFVRNPLAFFKSGNDGKNGDPEEFWALRDVSFEVKQGDVVGVIGRNGAGKSTLLKILSRITEPTKGRVRLFGRIASLLEVGTGFHPELTGRENIFLNGAILGMTRAEIKKKFDEIVAFSEVEKFLDTPVKRYSSGMYVRLAFSVAAHLEPEILIVDEVLAVGDGAFQKKCLGKMSEVSQSGRTVLFVSHQIQSVTRLCSKALWLHNGTLREAGPAAVICSKYLSDGATMFSRRTWGGTERTPGNEWVRLRSIEAVSEGADNGSFNIQQSVTVRMEYEAVAKGKVLIPNVHFHAEDGTLLFIAHDWHSGWRDRPKTPGIYSTEFNIPANFFSEGRISVRAAISTYVPFEVHIDVVDAISFHILDDPNGQGARGDFVGHYPGVVRPMIPSVTRQIG